jgi:hypothetical protein
MSLITVKTIAGKTVELKDIDVDTTTISELIDLIVASQKAGQTREQLLNCRFILKIDGNEDGKKMKQLDFNNGMVLSRYDCKFIRQFA